MKSLKANKQINAQIWQRKQPITFTELNKQHVRMEKSVKVLNDYL